MKTELVSKMTMIGDDNENDVIDWFIDNLLDSLSYDDLEHLRQGNFSVIHE